VVGMLSITAAPVSIIIIISSVPLGFYCLHLFRSLVSQVVVLGLGPGPLSQVLIENHYFTTEW